jgi:hypothetical protein
MSVDDGSVLDDACNDESTFTSRALSERRVSLFTCIFCVSACKDKGVKEQNDTLMIGFIRSGIQIPTNFESVRTSRNVTSSSVSADDAVQA